MGVFQHSCNSCSRKWKQLKTKPNYSKIIPFIFWKSKYGVFKWLKQSLRCVQILTIRTILPSFNALMAEYSCVQLVQKKPNQKWTQNNGDHLKFMCVLHCESMQIPNRFNYVDVFTEFAVINGRLAVNYSILLNYATNINIWQSHGHISDIAAANQNLR